MRRSDWEDGLKLTCQKGCKYCNFKKAEKLCFFRNKLNKKNMSVHNFLFYILNKAPSSYLVLESLLFEKNELSSQLIVKLGK